MGVTMSLHKLTAGSGYDYLTRQVAVLDATEKGHAGLAAYYTERGESPGVWIGSGMDGIDGVAAGDAVTVEQMPALFGCGVHPLAELRLQQLEGPDPILRDFQNVARLASTLLIIDEAGPGRGVPHSTVGRRPVHLPCRRRAGDEVREGGRTVNVHALLATG
jgi:hypothetical protein